MSLINKMLQDLDARGGPAGADPLLVKPVARPESRLAPRVALAVSVAALLAVGGWCGWRYLARPPVVAVASGPLPLAILPPGMVRVTPPQPAPVESAPVAAAPELVVEPAPVPVPAPVKQQRTQRRPQRTAAVVEHVATPVPDAPVVTRGARNAESDYRRALADLQDGRVTDAIAALERTLQTDPRHDSARQVLVSLLVEAKRNDDAMRQLQLGLGLDAQQPAMAMLLARLQLENRNGAAAVATLLRTLPYARGAGDYQAFLAGVLQRQGRNREAAEQYQAALAATPGNAVWLMGLGIVLQLDLRNAEALVAYQRAAASGTLSGELQAFVERKAQQLKQ